MTTGDDALRRTKALDRALDADAGEIGVVADFIPERDPRTVKKPERPDSTRKPADRLPETIEQPK